MKNFYSAPLLLFCSLVLTTSVFAQDTIGPKIEPFVNAALIEGQFVKSHYYYGNVRNTREVMPFRPWINNEYARIGVKSTVNVHFSAVICPEVRLWNDTWDWAAMGNNGAPNPFNQHVTVSLADAEGIVSYGSKDALACTMAFGVMPFKYDQDAKNLGEYLFRSGGQPAYVQNSFDNPSATITGFHANADMFDRLSLDLLLTQETRVMPMNDWSLSLLAGYKVPKLLDIGAGVMFDRLIPVAGMLDKPAMKGGGQDTFYTSDGKLDTLGFGGTKLMARVSFDPKGILPSGIAGIFGKEDGKIYAEATVLGTNSFTTYKKAINPATDSIIPGKYVVDSMMNFYSDIQQRIPVMLGFNVPTFKILDYLSVEVEYFGWPYAPSLYDYTTLNWALPKPVIPKVDSIPTLYTRSNKWKYSVNIRKTLWGSLSIIGQIARDHTRHDAYYSTFADPEEAFLQNGDWGWWLKLQYNL